MLCIGLIRSEREERESTDLGDEGDAQFGQIETRGVRVRHIEDLGWISLQWQTGANK